KITAMSLKRRLVIFCLLGSGALCAQSSPPTSSPENASKPDANASSAINGTPTTPADSTKLEPIKIVKAVYPQSARAEKIEGRVIIKITVTETGDVDDAEVISGNPILAAACLDAVKQWKFKPFIKNGNPVRVAANLPFEFKVPPPEQVPI